jgi:cysteine desulfurase / selenocysteine lyase
MDIGKIKSHFPAFRENPGWIYADNAATTQRPDVVIDAVNGYERKGVANVHRGLYKQAEESTARFEEARKKSARFIVASDESSIAFTKGTTESINIVAFGFLKHRLHPGDEVVITAMEHHANLLPWQQVCRERKAKLNVVPVNEKGELMMDALQSMITPRTRMVAVTHISNTLGTINPVGEIIQLAHKHHVPVLVDTAQSAACYPIDVNEWGVDFLAFSSHKMFGPFGVGALYAHPKHHSEMMPLNFGGGAIKHVTFSDAVWMDYPHGIEAGTQNISGVIGFSSSLDFVNSVRSAEASRHVELLGERFREGVKTLNGFRIIGEAGRRTGIVSVFHKRIHPHDIASFLAAKNIAVRAGHHCSQPLLDSLGIPATARFSFSIYNTMEDVEKILAELKELDKFWK